MFCFRLLNISETRTDIESRAIRDWLNNLHRLLISLNRTIDRWTEKWCTYLTDWFTLSTATFLSPLPERHKRKNALSDFRSENRSFCLAVAAVAEGISWLIESNFINRAFELILLSQNCESFTKTIELLRTSCWDSRLRYISNNYYQCRKPFDSLKNSLITVLFRSLKLSTQFRSLAWINVYDQWYCGGLDELFFTTVIVRIIWHYSPSVLFAQKILRLIRLVVQYFGAV